MHYLVDFPRKIATLREPARGMIVILCAVLVRTDESAQASGAQFLTAAQ